MIARLADERGLTLTEVVVTATVLIGGVLGTFSAFSGANRTTLAAQHREVAVHVAQRELEKLTVLPFADLTLVAQPEASADPAHPGSRLTGSGLRVRPDLEEPLAYPAQGQTGRVAPGPEQFEVPAGGSVVRGSIYRYVTWRDERCAQAQACAGTANTKRVLVAVTIDGVARRAGPRMPVWLSWVATDPNMGPDGQEQAPNANPGSGTPVTAQSFFLYDTPCSEDERQPQGQDHPTRNTASTGGAADDYSTCENPDASRRPDLMGPVAPPNPVEPDVPPLLRYSDDLTGTYPGGLAMKRQGATCPAGYPAADAEDPDAINKWTAHAWSTTALASAFALTGRVSFSFHTTTVDGASGRGMVCATVIDRATAGGVPTDTVLGAATYDLASWPTTVRHLSFTFDLPAQATIPAGHRLVLVVSVRGESHNDLVLLYDHPLYPSFLQTATTTPL